jgi:hypothetical protein
MARNRSAYNATDRPIVIDPDGRQLGGREHGKVDVELDQVLEAVEQGYLILAPDVAHPAPPAGLQLTDDPAAVAAAAELATDTDPTPARPRARRRTEES